MEDNANPASSQILNCLETLMEIQAEQHQEFHNDRFIKRLFLLSERLAPRETAVTELKQALELFYTQAAVNYLYLVRWRETLAEFLSLIYHSANFARTVLRLEPTTMVLPMSLEIVQAGDRARQESNATRQYFPSPPFAPPPPSPKGEDKKKEPYRGWHP